MNEEAMNSLCQPRRMSEDVGRDSDCGNRKGRTDGRQLGKGRAAITENC